MQKRSRSKATREEMAYELPDEADLRNRPYVGEGLDAVKKFVGERRTVVLDRDLANEFASERAVNSALRDFLRLREAITHLTAGKRRKTA